MNLKPPLKWVGGKRWLVAEIAKLYQPFTSLRLVEPFVGGMAVTLGLEPKSALLNDINPHLINFYQQIKAGMKIRQNMLNDADYYYKVRTELNNLIAKNKSTGNSSAWRFYYLMRTCYNGLCRFNSSGKYNVPFGKYNNINYIKNFTPFVQKLNNYTFTCCDFAKLKLQANDFIYLDPPYDAGFTKYHNLAFTWQDQIRLLEWASQHKGPIVASNKATSRIIKLYQKSGFTILTLLGPRTIACNGNRKPTLEMLATRGIDSNSIKELQLISKRELSYL